jgi:Outer membrane protein beta-barrel domain
MKTPIMKSVGRATAMLPLLCLVAAADEVPRVETFFGYSLIRFDSNGAAPTFTSNGGTAQLIYNFRPWLAAVGDFGGYHNGQVGGVSVNNTLANFQFGPRFSYRKKKKVSPYLQTLFGGAFATASKPVSDLNPHGSESAFAMLLGGGVEIRLGRHVAFRPAEVDYLLTHFRSPVTDTARIQDSLRYSTGVTFRFGRGY